MIAQRTKNRNDRKIAQRTNDPILRKFCYRLTDRQTQGPTDRQIN